MELEEHLMKLEVGRSPTSPPGPEEVGPAAGPLEEFLENLYRIEKESLESSQLDPFSAAGGVAGGEGRRRGPSPPLTLSSW